MPQLIEAFKGGISVAFRRRLDKRQPHAESGTPPAKLSFAVVRIVICQTMEGTSMRDRVVWIDDSNFFCRFVRIYNGAMMSFTTLCELKNAIRAKTWKKINDALARAAIESDLISGESDIRSL